MGAAATTEIVARLQLRADQFSSESGRAFADMASRAKNAAGDVRTSFGQSFAEVQKLAEQSLKLPRTATGSLDLSGEIASLRQAATAADQKAAVARELATAMQAAAASERTVTETIRAEADAAMVATRAEEANAGAIRQRILALEAVQAELNKTTSVTEINTRAANDNAVSAGQRRQSVMMLGQQVQDFSVQAANGGSVATAFSQQVGQAAFALTGMGGAAGKVGELLGGTLWGTALIVGLTVLTPLVSKVLEGNDALDEAVEKLKKDAQETELNSRAKARFGQSLEGLNAALRDQEDALKKTAEAERSSAERANINAKTKRDEALATREATVALLEQARARLAVLSTPGASDARLAPARDEVAASVASLEAKLGIARTAAAQAERDLNLTRVDLAAEEAKVAVDPVRAVTKLYDDRIKALKDAQREEAKLGRQVGAASLQRLKDLEREKQAEIEKAQARQAADRAAARRKPTAEFGRTVSSAEAASIARSAGFQVNSGDRTFASQKALYDRWVAQGRPTTNPVAKPGSSAHEFGNALDIQKAAGLTVDKIKSAFAAEGVRLTKVISEQGHWHVEWARSAQDAKAVTDAKHDETKATRDAAQAQRELDEAYGRVTSRIDPATAASERYRRALSDLDLASGGAGTLAPDLSGKPAKGPKAKLSGADFDQLSTDALENYREAFLKAQSDSFAQMLGPDQLKDIHEAFYGGIFQAAEDGGREFGEAAGDRLRGALGEVADMFGVRISSVFGGLLQPGGVEAQSKGVAESLLKGFGVKDHLSTRKLDGNIDITEHSIDKLSSRLGGVLSGAAYGQMGGSAFASITGGKSNPIGSAIGGALGGEAGKELGKVVTKEIGGALGKTLGSAAGPLGSIVGGVLGSVVGGLFRTVPKGSAGVNVSNGSITAGKATGTGAEATSQAASLAGSVAQGLQSIADTLGAKVTGSTDVQIGTYDGKWRVNDHGGAIGGVKGSGAISFDTQEQAISYAISDALKDGVLSGISSASLAILRSGQDLSKAIQKATLIEGVPKDLKAMLDPVGAAIDELNRKFQKTVDALKEGGASAEQMAQAERLYNLQLEQVKNTTASASQTLKDFQSSLKLGSSSPYSLRDQEEAARAALKPFLDQIAGGQSIDQSKYQSAAQTYLDVERQLYGSTKAYFDALDSVQAATNKAISTIDNATPIGGAVESPFARATADSTAKTASGVETIAEQNDDTNALLARLVAAVESLGGGGSDGSDFIGTTRAFVAAKAA